MAANDNKQVTAIPVLATGDSTHTLSVPVTIQGGAGSGGTSSNFAAAFPVAGTALGAKDSAGANMAPLNLDASGYLKVNVAAGGAGGGAATVADGADVAQGAVADVAVVTDAGGTLSAKLRGLIVVLLRAFALGTPLRVDPTGTTNQPVTQSGTWTVQPGNTANTTAWKIDGSAVTQPVSIAAAVSVNATLKPATSGGYTPFHLMSAASTNATNIKASAGQLYGWFIYNSNAAARKVAFHNTAGTPTAGASVLFSLMIPPLSGANVFTDVGIPFSTGIAITTVTGLADNDTAAVAANDLNINLFYN